METIKNYLENMFAGISGSARMEELKYNMLTNMEEKYIELKAEGKSENEAIGIVISEFGNIDELMNELGITKGEENSSKPVITLAETREYLAAKRKAGVFIGLGVVLCILAAATLIGISQLVGDGFIPIGLSGAAKNGLALIPFFILITIAVGIFIFNGMKLEKYQYIEQGVQLPVNVKNELQRGFDSFKPAFTLAIVFGVGMCIMSPVALFVTEIFNGNVSEYGIVIMLSIIACAVFIFIYFGFIHDSYSRLLSLGEYSVKKEKENKVISAVASVVWPLAVVVFLLLGFLNNAWHIAWIVFPITGLLFGAFSAAYSIFTGENSR